MLLFNDEYKGAQELFVRSESGSYKGKLTNKLLPLLSGKWHSWWGTWNADHTLLLFCRVPTSYQGNFDSPGAFSEVSLWTKTGSTYTQIRPKGRDGWTVQGHPEISPDGTKFACVGGAFENPQIFICDIFTGEILEQLTTGPGLHLDPSWIDDELLLFTQGTNNDSLELHLISATEKIATPITAPNTVQDYDPYWSPKFLEYLHLQNTDPSGFNGVGAWRVFVTDANGSRAVTPVQMVSSRGTYSEDGARVYFSALSESNGWQWTIYSVLTDGTDLRLETAGHYPRASS